MVSGDPAAVAELVARCEAEGIRARVLPVDYASHGPQVEKLEAEILAALDGIEPRPARIPMISAMTGEILRGPEADARYWYASLRAPVEFARSVTRLADSGHRVFIEASPQPVLTAAITETLDEAGTDATVTGTLRRGDGGPARLLASLAQAYVHGATVDWTAVLPPAPPAELPTYAFQHQRYWPPAPAAAAGSSPGTAAEARFWAAVDNGDLDQVAGTLAVDGRRPFSEVLPALSSWRKRQQAGSAVQSWRYRVTWAPVPGPGTAALSGTWLLLAPAGQAPPHEAADPGGYAAALAAHGARVITLPVSPGETSREALAARIAQALHPAGHDPVPAAGILSLLALDETPLPGLPAVPAGLAATVALVQALGDTETQAPLWVATRGAVAAAPGETLRSPVQAQCWGLGRVAALEHPDRWGGLIDLPPADRQTAPSPKTAEQLCTVLAGCGEDQVAIRSSGLLARRMMHAVPSQVTRPWAPSGAILVTGGTGGLGGHVARWLASRAATRVILASREGAAAPGAAALAAELAGAGTAVQVTACDVASRDELAGLIARAAADSLPISGVFHAAGVALGGPIADITATDLSVSLAAKAAGAAHLDELTRDLELNAFVLFSSVSALWGSAWLAGYAAANTFLDALAEERHARGLGRHVGDVGALGRRRDGRRRSGDPIAASRGARDGPGPGDRLTGAGHGQRAAAGHGRGRGLGAVFPDLHGATTEPPACEPGRANAGRHARSGGRGRPGRRAGWAEPGGAGEAGDHHSPNARGSCARACVSGGSGGGPDVR